MEISEARLNANRLNSLKSKGPKTPSGKAISRQNALKHGFRAEVLAVEDPEAVRVLADGKGDGDN